VDFQSIRHVGKGGKFVVEFKDGTPNGQGTRYLSNGRKLVGEFEGSNGNWSFVKGILYESDGSIMKEW